jgi:hypothetical protein
MALILTVSKPQTGPVMMTDTTTDTTLRRTREVRDVRLDDI